MKQKKILIGVLASLIVGAVILAIILIFRSKNSSFPAPEKPSERKPLPENPESPPLPNDDCPYLNEANLTTCSDKCNGLLKMVLDKESVNKWRKIPASFIVNCWNKGYHWHDILQLWDWKLEEKEIPSLKNEKRIGVVNSLHILIGGGLPISIISDDSISKEEKKRMFEDDSVSGHVKNLVAIIRNKPADESSVKIDSKIPKDGLYGKRQSYFHKLIKLFCQQEKINLNQYQICLLECIGAEYLEKEGDIKFGVSYGKSTGSAIYLALLSAFYQKPISHQVSTTGYITTKKRKIKLNNSEIEVAPGTNLPIGGIKGKTIGASKKRINCLVLSKFQTAPNRPLIWTKKGQKWMGGECKERDDYQAVVPTKIKAKIKKVHWTEKINQLRDLVLEGKIS